MTTTATPSTTAKQTFSLIVGESYRVTPPVKRKLGVIYTSGICKLIEVTADGKARFESRLGTRATVLLADNRIFGF
jgi:hypothetical protein